MNSLKHSLAAMILLVGVAQAKAEDRTVLIQIKQPKDQRVSVAIHSDDKKEQEAAASTDDAVKVIGQMQSWRSRVGVYVTADNKALAAPSVHDSLRES